MGGAPVGAATAKGYGTAQSWALWTQWSGHNLNGKTRDELMQEFLQLSSGVYGKPMFLN
jgi:hypothetical protein